MLLLVGRDGTVRVASEVDARSQYARYPAHNNDYAYDVFGLLVAAHCPRLPQRVTSTQPQTRLDASCLSQTSLRLGLDAGLVGIDRAEVEVSMRVTQPLHEWL
jgi:hypothetical protein